MLLVPCLLYLVDFAKAAAAAVAVAAAAAAAAATAAAAAAAVVFATGPTMLKYLLQYFNGSLMNFSFCIASYPGR